MKVDDKTPPFFVVLGNNLMYITEKKKDDKYLKSAEISMLAFPTKRAIFKSKGDEFVFTKERLEENGVDPNDVSIIQKRNAIMNLLEYKE